MKLTKNQIGKLMIIAVAIYVMIGLIFGIILFFIFGVVRSENIMCPNTNLIKIQDFEGNHFVYENTKENKNLYTSDITYYETQLGIKSVARIKENDKLLIYITKNEKLSFNELNNINSCFKNAKIDISNSYNYNEGAVNKFCDYQLKVNSEYEITNCK